MKKYLVKSVVMNPFYNSDLNSNDIALLVLSKNLQFSNEIQKIELPPAECPIVASLPTYVDPFEQENVKFLTAGWGRAYDLREDFKNESNKTVTEKEIPT